MLTAIRREPGLIPRSAHLSFIRSRISFTVSNNTYRVGIVGATGAVGQELLALLQSRPFPLAELRPMASARSAGREIAFAGKKLTVREATPDAFEGLDLAFFAAGNIGGVLIRVAGELDLSSVPQLRSCLSDLVNTGQIDLVLDLADVTFCDSTGIGLLLDAATATRDRGGWTRLAATQPPVARIIELLTLDRVFAMYHSVAAAVSAPAAD